MYSSDQLLKIIEITLKTASLFEIFYLRFCISATGNCNVFFSVSNILICIHCWNSYAKIHYIQCLFSRSFHSHLKMLKLLKIISGFKTKEKLEPIDTCHWFPSHSFEQLIANFLSPLPKIQKLSLKLSYKKRRVYVNEI